MDAFSPIIKLRSILDCPKLQYLRGKSSIFRIWILQIMEAHTAVAGHRQKSCLARRCRAHHLAQEGINIQLPLCVQEHLVNAKDLLLRGKMIHEVQGHLSLSRFLQDPHALLQDPHAHLPVRYSGRKGSCLAVERLGKYTLDSTGA
jgi:hypothetical protein